MMNVSTVPRRFGIILPSVNTVVENDFRQFRIDGVTSHFTRVALRGATTEAQEEALNAAPDAATLLADARVDAIMFACTGASMIRGMNGGNEFSAAVKASTGVPATTVADALVEGLRALGLRSVALFSPFDEKLNEMEAAYLHAAGFKVVSMHGLGMKDGRLCADLSPGELVSAAVTVDRPDAEGIILSCANIRAFEAVATLEKKLKKPIITTNQVMMWKLMQMIGLRPAVSGGGMLLSGMEEAACYGRRNWYPLVAAPEAEVTAGST